MEYNFDRIIDRSGTFSVKWNVAEDELPMWVADMDFQTAPPVMEAVVRRAEHGIFGYTEIPEEWYQAYIGWWERRHDFLMEKEWMIYSTGIIPSISTAVRRFTSPNENVVIQTPVYNVFFNSILNSGRRVLESPLCYHADTKAYEMDFEDLERKLQNPQTSLMILCNPQNPVGRIWTAHELARVAELAYRYDVLVLSDEVHCEMTAPGKNYVPFLSSSDAAKKIGIMLASPTKCFNFAGIPTSAAIVPDRTIRHRLWRALNTEECGGPNSFSIAATIAAYEKGADWMDALRAYICENKRFAVDYIERNIPQVSAGLSDATYLLWVDCSKVTEDSRELAGFLRESTGLFVSGGALYGAYGNRFLRINLGCPGGVVEDGMKRLREGIRLFCSEQMNREL